MMAISLDSAYTCRGLYPSWWVMSSKGTCLPACCAEATVTIREGALACSVSSSSWVSRNGAKNVEGERHLQPICAQLALAEHPTGVVDQDVEPWVGVAVGLREGADLCQRREIGHE